MPRKPRIIRQNGFHHIMFRGVNGENIFLDNADRSRFCLLLQEACEKNSILVHGFCLMSNHLHLILEPKEKSLQSGIHAFGFRYAQYFNRRHKRKGYLFQGRFRSIIVEDSVYLKRLIRYIHLNPVEANVEKLPENYRWSSYRAYLGHDHYVWLETDNILRKFNDTKELAIRKLIAFTNQKNDGQSDFEIISKAFRKGALGPEGFMELQTFEQFQNQSAIQKSQSAPQNQSNSLEEMVDSVCNSFKVSVDDLISSSKNMVYVEARGALALLVRQSKSCSIEELARFLNKNSGSLSRLASNSEKKKNRPLL